MKDLISYCRGGNDMKKIVLMFLLAFLLSGCSLPFLTSKKAALQVNAEPQSNVFLNGNHVGQTPYYDENLKPGEYVVKIQSNSYPSMPWEANVVLHPQVVSVVNRTFGESLEKSSHYIIQMESLADKNSSEIAVVTTPDNVIVKLDNQPEGFSPLSLKDLSEGEHTITLSAPSYKDEQININVKASYKMIISASLARTQVLPDPTITPEASSSAQLNEGKEEEVENDTTPTPSPTKKAGDDKVDLTPTPTKKATSNTPEKPYVVILETGTGWLRVRSTPNASADNEVAKVDVGDTFPFIEKDGTGWIKIEYEPGEEGWIAAKYADLVE
jgi:hypothetical protein